MATLLAIETSCDETSAAIIRDGCVLANVVSSQIKLHSEYGGVVPELATREHLRNLTPVIRSALQKASVTTGELSAIAATRGPGLPAALMVGLKAGQGMAFALRKPFLGIHHHEAHLYSPWITGTPPQSDFDKFEPNVSLIVSGGHTLLVLVKSEIEHEVLGGTLDDAAGECFDKVAKLMGLPYPGGPEMDRLAASGNPKAYDFPRPMLNDPDHQFSFAGLKTSVRYFLQKKPELLRSEQALRDVCASVQQAIVDVLVIKTIRAAQKCNVRCITASGGVTCNRALRQRLSQECSRKSFNLRLADNILCTDNAAMIGILAERRLTKGALPTDLDAEIQPAWELASANVS